MAKRRHPRVRRMGRRDWPDDGRVRSRFVTGTQGGATRRLEIAAPYEAASGCPAGLRCRLLDPHIALLDALEERLGIEPPEGRWNLEQGCGLRLLVNVLNTDGRAVLQLDAQREFETDIDPAKQLLARGRSRPVGDDPAPVDHFFPQALAPQWAARISAAREGRHILPLHTGIVEIERNEQLVQPARLPGIHEDPRTGSHEIGRADRAVDQEEPVRKVRRFDPDLILEDMQLAGRRRRPTGESSANEIGRELLRPRWRSTTDQDADEAERTQP